MNIGRSAPRYERMALLYPHSIRLQSHLAEYFVVVVSFCHQIWKFAQKPALSKFVSALGDFDLKTYQSDMENWANAIKEEVSMLMAQEVHEKGYELGRIKSLVMGGLGFASAQQKLQKRLRVLDLCSTYDFQTTWKQIRKIGNSSLFSRCDEYKKWRGQANSSTLIYVGKLGAGKSVLLANIVDDLSSWAQERSTPIAYFFCRHDISESLTAQTVFGSLARQLLLSLQDFAMPDKHPIENAFHLDIESISNLLQNSFPKNQPAYIVLDGLDECDSTTRSLLLQQLQELQKMIILHLCISIRLDPATGQTVSLHGLTAAERVLMPDDNPDIEAYVDAELESCINSGKLKIGNPAIILEIQRRLMKGSQGMFLWVALQLRTLCSMQTDDSIRQALDNLPRDLPETFSRILEKSGDQEQIYQRRTLQLVTGAFRPLTTEELREALSVKPDCTEWRPSSLINDIISVLSFCGSLVIVDEEEQTVRLVHHSFKQFLLDSPKVFGYPFFTIDLIHEAIAAVIISYLNYSIFGNELSTTVAPDMKMGAVPSQVIQTAITSDTGRNIALKLLKSRKTPNFDMSKAVANVTSRNATGLADTFHFYAYAKLYCVLHVFHSCRLSPTLVEAMFRLITKNLIDANAEVEYGRTILSKAAENGNVGMVRRLVDSGKVIINSKDSSGRTPLSWAAGNGHEDIVKLLVDWGAEIDSRDSYRRTPLSWATRNGEVHVVKVLVNSGANIHSEDS